MRLPTPLSDAQRGLRRILSAANLDADPNDSDMTSAVCWIRQVLSDLQDTDDANVEDQRDAQT